MKWTHKKPTKEGFYLYVDNLNLDGNPIVLEVCDFTYSGCQPKAKEDIEERDKLIKKHGRTYRAYYQNSSEHLEIEFIWLAGEVNRDKNAFWSAKPIPKPK